MPTLFYPPHAYIPSASGSPQAGALAYFYITATSTPKNTYSDFALTTPNANPVVADANGVWGAIYLASDINYRVTIKTSAGATIYTQDDVQGINGITTTLPTDTAMSNGAAYYLGYQLGTAGGPTSNTQPLINVTRYTSGGTSNYDGGAGWFSNYREGGTNAAKGLTGYVQVDGGTKDAVAIHGFARATIGTTAAVFSGWFTTHDDNTSLQAQAFGVEMDLVLKVSRSHVTTSIGSNAAVGLWVNNQSDAIGNFHATAAIGITGESNSGGFGFTSQWYTGLFFQQNCIVPGTANEAIKINGAGSAANRYTGIRMDGELDIGIDLSSASFSGTAAALLIPNLIAIYGKGSGGSNYNLMYVNAAGGAGNVLVLGQGTPGGINLNSATQCSSTLTVPGAATPVLTANTTVTNGAGAGAGTLLNAPAAGNPTKWIPFNDAGVTRYFPSW